MKKIIIKTALIALCVTVLLGIFSFVNEDVKKGSVIIRSSQFSGAKYWKKSIIKVYKADGTFEKIPLDQKEYTIQDNEENFDKIIELVRKYEAMGLKVISHEEITNGYLNCFHTFVLSEK